MAPRQSGFLAEYPLVRVDNFTANFPLLPPCIPRSALDDLADGATQYAAPHIHLLSHVHSDHLAGLGSLSRHSAPIYCSHITRRLLLGLERIQDRTRHDAGHGPRIRPYRGLYRSESEQKARSRAHHARPQAGLDLLHPLAFHSPTLVSYSARFQIRLTLLPANHMPGSTMFLVEGPRGAVLHTGDVRAETAWLEALLARSLLCRYAGGLGGSTLASPWLHASSSAQDFDSATEPPPGRGRIETIYLDTERLLDSQAPMSKNRAIVDGLELLALLPADALVFLDCWTAGYEDFLYAVHCATGTRIHVDRYKAWMLAQGEEDNDNDAYCANKRWHHAISTDIDSCGRIHACERTAKCTAMNTSTLGPSPLIVEVEMAECIGEMEWKRRKSAFLEDLRAAAKNLRPWPRKLTIPLQRHSPLPELYDFVRRLRPRRIAANTGDAAHQLVCDRLADRLDLGTQYANGHGYPDYGRYQRVWNEASDSYGKEEAGFFAKVHAFHSSLRVPREDRLRKERMDADADIVGGLEDADSTSTSEGEDGYEADISRLSATAQAISALNVWDSVTGRFATSGASPWITPAMRQHQDVASTVTATAPDTSETDAPVLTEELASRYLAYAGMYLGYRIRNPSRYAQPVAWRGFRKVKPDVARLTEEALQRELGCRPPPWEQAVPRLPRSPLVSLQEKKQATPPSTPIPSKTLLTSTQSISPFGLPSPVPLTTSPEKRLENAPFLASALDRDAAVMRAQSCCHDENSTTQGTEDDVEVVCVMTRSPVVDERADYASILAHLRRGSKPNVAPDLGAITCDMLSSGRHSAASVEVKIGAAMLLGLGLRSLRARALLGWVKPSRWPVEIKAGVEDALDALLFSLEHDHLEEEQSVVKLVMLLRKLLDDFHRLPSYHPTQKTALDRRVRFREDANMAQVKRRCFG